MKSKKLKKYIAFLGGINVGGHHKVPMATLGKELKKLGFENVVTLLNSGNIIFDTTNNNLEEVEKMISSNLEKKFGFQIPTIIRNSESIEELFNEAPFQNVNVTKDIRLYVSFLRKDTETDLELPWTSSDNSYKIIELRDRTIFSVLDLSVSRTPKAMEAVENFFGTDITTRNWKTIERIVKKLQASR
jgi:uncharacterized protein (DUF1697 family)